MDDTRPKALGPNTPPVSPAAAPPQAITKWSRLTRIRNRIIAIWLGGIVCELALVPLVLVFPFIKPYFLGAAGALTVVWFGACCAGLMLQGSLEKHLQQTLKSRDISGLGCWIDILSSPVSTGAYPQMKAKYYAETRYALLEQLPLLTEETAYLLRSGDRQALYKALAVDDAELISAVLRAVPVFGDAHALPSVRRLAEGRGAAATNPALQAEAQSTLRRLLDRLAAGGGAHGLLRASQPPEPPTEELLLPAQASSESDGTELLRAGAQNKRTIDCSSVQAGSRPPRTRRCRKSSNPPSVDCETDSGSDDHWNDNVR